MSITKIGAGGSGECLYKQAMDFARSRGAKRMVTNFREWTPTEPAIAFLKARGFAEQEREIPSFLDLTAWDAAPLCRVRSLRRKPMGAEFFTLAEVGDTEENRQAYYALEKPLIYDIPRRDDQPFVFEPYEDWLTFVVQRPEWRPDLVLLAAVGGEWFGECHIVPKSGNASCRDAVAHRRSERPSRPRPRHGPESPGV